MPRTLRARATNAGTTERTHMETRPYGRPVEKGGWITLEWETFNGRRVVTMRRDIAVSRARAIQAMAALAAAKPVV